MKGIRPPPFLLGAALLFWGWQTDMVGAGAIMALAIELPRWSRTRWDISEEEFGRIWTFCTLLLLAGVVYAFTLNDGPDRFSEMFQDPDLKNQAQATASSARTAAALIRWLPMIFFLFVAAQHYSARGGVPLETISLILRYRWKKAKKLGLPVPPSRSVDVSYVYFILCLFASSIHTEETLRFFWGAAILVGWALWPYRSRRYRPVTWAFSLGGALAMAWYGQQTLSHLQQYIENLNPQWLSTMSRSRFDANQSKTSLGQIGRMKSSPRIAVRVEAKDGPVPELLREASYNIYRGHTWTSSGDATDFERVDETPPIGTFYLVPGKTNLARVGIASFLPGKNGLLPLPTSTGCLTNLFVVDLKKNPFGAVNAQGPGLVIFDAWFGPGAVGDSRPDGFDDLYVPEREEAVLDEVIAELDLKGKSRVEVLARLSKFFAGFEYSTWQELPRGGRGGYRGYWGGTNYWGTNNWRTNSWQSAGSNYWQERSRGPWSEGYRNEQWRDAYRSNFLQSGTHSNSWWDGTRSNYWRSRSFWPGRRDGPSVLRRFLIETKKGHCEYFATATVLLLHRLEMPARYAVGYYVHERSPGEGHYVVRERDAHAWCLVWDEDRSVWRDFDTTPGSWLAAEDRPDWRQTLSDAWSRVVFEFLKIRWGQTNYRRYIFWVVSPILLILLGQIVFSSRKRLKTRAAGMGRNAQWPGLDSEFYELEKHLARDGFVRPPGESILQWLQRGAQANETLSASGDSLREIVRLHYRYRFDPFGLGEEERESLRQHARSLVAKLKRV